MKSNRTEIAGAAGGAHNRHAAQHSHNRLKQKLGRSVFRYYPMAIGLGFAVVMSTGAVHAENWLGAVSTDWNDSGNWDGGLAPSAGTMTIIDGTGGGSQYFPVIGSGQTANSGNTVIGATPGTESFVTVDGAGAVLNIHNGLNIGDPADGTLMVSNGGLVDTQGTFIEVGGGGGKGVLAISGGGTARTALAFVGTWDGGRGAVTVDGAQSRWTVDPGPGTNVAMVLGALGGTGELTVRNGGVVDSIGTVYLGGFTGYAMGGRGSASVEGAGSQWISDQPIIVGNNADGRLSVSDGGQVSVSEIRIADAAGSSGSLVIGGDADAAALAPGMFHTDSITFGAGEGEIVFNHTAGGYDFSPLIAGTGKVSQYAGTTILVAGSSYSGLTTVYGGTLAAGGASLFSTSTDFDIRGNGTLALNGHLQSLQSLTNAGTVSFGGENGVAGTLLVTGDYHGDAGTLVMNVALGDDASASDRMIVNGDSTGSSFIKINNSGGTGAQTVADGIKIIEVSGQSAGRFTLVGESIHDGQPEIWAGVHAYKLYQNGLADTTDGDWYLRSRLGETPVDPVNPVDPVDPVEPMLYQPSVPVYEAYPQLLLAMNGLPTLRQRAGNRVWSGSGNRVVAQGADIAGTGFADAEISGTAVAGNGVWGRIEGAHSRQLPDIATSLSGYDTSIYRVQAGIDGLVAERESGYLLMGLTAHYIRGTADSWSDYDDDRGGGELRSDGYGAGGNFTFYGDSGFYLDGQGQVTWYDSDLRFAGGAETLVDGQHGTGYALSMEAGQQIALSDSMSVTPQAQLLWSRVRFDDFTGARDIGVSLERGESLQGRLGFALDHQSSWYNARGMLDRVQAYGIANLYYEFLEGTRVMVVDSSFASRNARLWGGIGMGGSYNWDDDRYAVFGEGSVSTSLSDFGDSYSYTASLGLRAKW